MNNLQFWNHNILYIMFADHKIFLTIPYISLLYSFFSLFFYVDIFYEQVALSSCLLFSWPVLVTCSWPDPHAWTGPGCPASAPWCAPQAPPSLSTLSRKCWGRQCLPSRPFWEHLVLYQEGGARRNPGTQWGPHPSSSPSWPIRQSHRWGWWYSSSSSRSDMSWAHLLFTLIMSTTFDSSHHRLI